MSLASVYPLYVQKAENKGRTRAEVDEIIRWLTGYTAAQLTKVIATKVDVEAFFAKAPNLNRKATLITGGVCGVPVEDAKPVDELARGKAMDSILRA